MSQGGAINMNLLSQIRNGEQQRHGVDKVAVIGNLVAALRETERALQASIRTEEEKTALHDRNDPCYSMLAHSMRARADNLRMTIATLEATGAVA